MIVVLNNWKSTKWTCLFASSFLPFLAPLKLLLILRGLYIKLSAKARKIFVDFFNTGLPSNIQADTIIAESKGGPFVGLIRTQGQKGILK